MKKGAGDRKEIIQEVIEYFDRVSMKLNLSYWEMFKCDPWIENHLKMETIRNKIMKIKLFKS